MGAVNGVLIACVRIAPFIATLGMLSFASGVVLGLTKGWPIGGTSLSAGPAACSAC
jgi:ribose/xylose/arabinose/galactoside ABC-type transport system permease subunit